MHVHRQGAGEPLVLLHGVGHHWQAWLPVLDRLAARHDVLAVDSPGFGRSPALPDGVVPTVWAYADAARLRHVTLDAGHLPFTDDPDGVVDAVLTTTAAAG